MLVLVVDPTASSRSDLGELRDALVDVAAEGPRGLRIGVLGAAAEWTAPGHVGDARSALTALATVPLNGDKNLLEAVREAVGSLPDAPSEARAVVLVTRDGGDGEDDLEATRALLLAKGVVFHSVAPEAAFERPWIYDFKAREDVDLGLTQRWNPMPRARRKGELFYGSEVAFGLTPYRWELEPFPFAQAEFAWAGRGRFPVPSGFGYYDLATLSWSTGGRCFVFNFKAPGARTIEQDRTLSLYDMGFLNLFAPDLRPRAEVLRALEQDRTATTIVKVWDLLSSEDEPLVLDHATLERAGSGLLARPMLPVRSGTDFEVTYRLWSQVERAIETATARKKRVEQALALWTDEARREITPTPGAKTDPLRERSQADFDMLGAQLLKVRFHWGEVIAALGTIQKAQLDGEHELRLDPVPLAHGVTVLKEGLRLPDASRAAAFVDLMAAARRILNKYHSTPWALMVQKGDTFTFRVDSRELKPPPIPKGEAPKPSKPSAPPAPPPPPPPPERPSSGLGGPTTGGR